MTEWHLLSKEQSHLEKETWRPEGDNRRKLLVGCKSRRTIGLTLVIILKTVSALHVWRWKDHCGLWCADSRSGHIALLGETLVFSIQQLKNVNKVLLRKKGQRNLPCHAITCHVITCRMNRSVQFYTFSSLWLDFNRTFFLSTFSTFFPHFSFKKCGYLAAHLSVTASRKWLHLTNKISSASALRLISTLPKAFCVKYSQNMVASISPQ